MEPRAAGQARPEGTPTARPAEPPERGTGRERGRGRVIELLALTALAYVPFLLSSPGRVTADTKSYLYFDPAKFVSRAPYLWDPHFGFGTVPHQGIGYLFPMGPFFWATERLGLPWWVAQRFWLGTISLAAVLGARWLFRQLGVGRAGALAGALVYMLTPYQLAFTARESVLLLAWAGLPWLVGLTMRATRVGTWRDPALVALIVFTVGSVNASTLLFALIGPGLWLLVEATRGRRAFGAAVRAGLRIGVLVVGVSVWWVVGLRTQANYGLPVLQLTESVKTVATASTPIDVLRGIGNWYFYGRDRLGYSIDQASSYVNDVSVQFASFAVPVLALAAAAVFKWRHRAYFLVLLLVGSVVAVGSWPYDDPSAYGRLFRGFTSSSAGLALRNSPRAVPLIVLALAGLLAAAVSAVTPVVAERLPRLWRAAPAVLVGAVAIAALIPVWTTGYLSRHLDSPENLPSYWYDAAAALQRDGNDTRILEIPGTPFAAYRWGNVIDTIVPYLVDRPWVGRETLPTGSPPSVNFLVALDRRVQQGVLEPDALAAYARLGGIGTVLLRSDLEWERFDTPRPQLLWAQLTDPVPTGLRPPLAFGPTTPNTASPQVPVNDALSLRIPTDAANPPKVALFQVKDALPIVHAAPTEQPVLLAGDGEGIVDAAAAGIVDGRALVLETGSLTPAELRRELRAGADLVLTDSNRRRNQQYFAGITDNSGLTERAGEDSATDEFRLDPFPQNSDSARTVVEQHGATVDATTYATPTDRPANALDGDPRTAWLVDGAVNGAAITVRAETPQQVDHVTLTQRPTGPQDRWVKGVKLTFDDGSSVEAPLDLSSLTAPGQTITFPARTSRTLRVELLGVNSPTDRATNGVGFTEIGFGDVRVHETVRLPLDVARLGTAANGHRLDVVLSRSRFEPAARQDEELLLDRRFVVPDTRAFLLSGTTRVDPNAHDDTIDSVLGTTASGTVFTSSGHLYGDADARASRAFDHDPTTAWTGHLGPQAGQWLDVTLPAPVAVDHADLTIVADGRHSVPTRVTVTADGGASTTVDLPAVTDGRKPGTLHTVPVTFPAVTTSHLRITVDAVREVTTHPTDALPDVLPVAIAETGLAGVPAPANPTTVPSACRADLVQVDGHPVPVSVRGTPAEARSGLDVVACDPSLALAAGSHTVTTAKGLDTGLDVDRVVLSSDTAGRPAPVTAAGAPASSAGTSVHVVSSSPDSFDLRARTDGKPFWLVLGQSHNDGWTAKVNGHVLGGSTLVNGYANGWRIAPARAGTLHITLEWTPQRAVWIGLAISGIAVFACVLLVALGSRRERRRTATLAIAGLADSPAAQSPLRFTGPPLPVRTLAASAVAVGIGVALVSQWWIGLVVAAAMFVVPYVTGGRLLLTAGAPLALALGALFDIPELGWLALGLLAADLVVGWWRGRGNTTPPPDPPAAPGS